LQARFPTTEFLRLVWLTPDIGVFQFSQSFLELLFFAIEVKDTPSDRYCAISGH
jgi:hypothetical protein